MLLTFNFNVDANGKFTYSPPANNPAATPGSTNWPYTHQDQLEFRCKRGPFALKLLRTDIAPGAGGARHHTARLKQRNKVRIGSRTCR